MEGGSRAAPRFSLLGGSGSSKLRSGLFSRLVGSALPLSSTLLLQQHPCSAELGPSFPEGRLSCHLPLAEQRAGCDLLCALPPAPCPPLAGLTETPWHARLSSMEVSCHPGGVWGQAPSSWPLSAPQYSPGVLLVAAYQPFFVIWQGPTPRLSLAISEGCWWVLNCLKLIKSSWVDILNRTFVASVNL